MKRLLLNREIIDGKNQYSIRIKSKKTLANTAACNGSATIRGIGEEFFRTKIENIFESAM